MKHYFSTPDSYSIYKALSNNPIEKPRFLVIANHFMKFLVEKLFTTGSIIIPERLGKIEIFGKKVRLKIEDGEIKGLAPDWAETKKLWEEDPVAKENKQLVYHFNEETNGVRYRFSWSKNRVLVSNKTYYNLIMTRGNKRSLSKLIKEGKEYLIVK